MFRRTRLSSFARARSGSVAVEAALVVPVAVLLFIGTVDFGAAMMARTELFNAVRAGLQYALVYPGDVTGMQTAVLSASSTENGAGTITVNASNACHCKNGTSVPGTCAGSCAGQSAYQMATITASQTYTLLLSFPGFPRTINLSQTASIRTTNN